METIKKKNPRAATVSADEAAKEFKASVDAWLADYKKRHEEEPEMYPLILPAENAGLWGDFIYDFYNNGE